MEHCRAAGAIVLAVAKSNGLPADFANLEVDAVSSLFGAVMVEAQDENIDIEVGERIGSDLAIKSDSLGVAYGPVVGALIASATFLMVFQSFLSSTGFT